MTAIAEKLINDFQKLSTEEQRNVRDQLDSITKVKQLEAVERLRGSGKGENLLKSLLQDRARERSSD